MRSLPKILAPILFLFAAACASTRVPDVLARGRALPPQAITAVDIAPDGRTVAVATLAFRQDKNIWVLSDNGEVKSGRHVAPWAPMQVAGLAGGQALGVGLAYSRVTSPLPTISLFSGSGEETVLEDSHGERGWLRYGAGDWRTGWIPSLLGDLLVRTDDAVVTVRGHNGALRLLADGRTEKFPLKDDRPFRIAASRDGRKLAFGNISPDGPVPGFKAAPLVSVLDATAAAEAWKYSPPGAPTAVPELPQPALDFPDLDGLFRIRPDAVVPFRVAASVAANADASAVAVAEYGGRFSIRRGPFVGKWDPPYHVIPFVHRQRGSLVLVKAPGTETARVLFPQDGLFEVLWEPDGKILAYPLSWFARGMAGAAWLPADAGARSVYEFDPAAGAWRTAWEFPDAVADVALHPEGSRAWVSCWDGKLYLVHRDGRAPVTIEAGAPARLKWARDGRFAIAGAESGEVLCLGETAEPRWRVKLASSPPPPVEASFKPVFEGIPVYQVGRTGKEHAYVGDTWLIKTGTGSFLIDAGGSSSIPFTLDRIRAAGVDPNDVHELLHTHTHGDHCGASYLWRSMGLKIVAPASAEISSAWLMPTLTDYGVWVPRPVDVPLPLKRPGDETEFTAAGQKIRAVFVPGHSLDLVIYLMEVGGRRLAFTGDLGFQAPSDILHRCWGDTEKAAVVTEIVKRKVLPFRPDVVFTGHGGRAEGTAFLEDLVKRSEESIEKAKAPK